MEKRSFLCWWNISQDYYYELEVEVKSMRNNAVNIEFLQERTKKLTEDVEKLIRNGNGHQ